MKADTQWLDPRDAARMSGAALTRSAAESLVKNDTVSSFGSPRLAWPAPAALRSRSADEVKLEELRAIATQRMAKQRMYEYVKARPAAAGGGARTAFSATKTKPQRRRRGVVVEAVRRRAVPEVGLLPAPPAVRDREVRDASDQEPARRRESRGGAVRKGVAQ